MTLQQAINANGNAETFYLFTKASEIESFSKNIDFSNVKEDTSKDKYYSIIFDNQVRLTVYVPNGKFDDGKNSSNYTNVQIKMDSTKEFKSFRLQIPCYYNLQKSIQKDQNLAKNKQAQAITSHADLIHESGLSPSMKVQETEGKQLLKAYNLLIEKLFRASYQVIYSHFKLSYPNALFKSVYVPIYPPAEKKSQQVKIGSENGIQLIKGNDDIDSCVFLKLDLQFDALRYYSGKNKKYNEDKADTFKKAQTIVVTQIIYWKNKYQNGLTIYEKLKDVKMNNKKVYPVYYYKSEGKEDDKWAKQHKYLNSQNRKTIEFLYSLIEKNQDKQFERKILLPAYNSFSKNWQILADFVYNEIINEDQDQVNVNLEYPSLQADIEDPNYKGAIYKCDIPLSILQGQGDLIIPIHSYETMLGLFIKKYTNCTYTMQLTPKIKLGYRIGTLLEQDDEKHFSFQQILTINSILSIQHKISGLEQQDEDQDAVNFDVEENMMIDALDDDLEQDEEVQENLENEI